MHKINCMILTLLLLSCKDASVNDQSENLDEIVFESEYINYAWGFSYQGKMVQKDGSIFSYNPAKDTIPVLHHADGYYTKQELLSKYQHAKTFLRKIDVDSLHWANDLAIKVTTNDLSDTMRVGADMGSFVYSVYIYRPQNTKYQKIILRTDGDYTFYNKSENAITLVTWMRKY